MDQAQKALLPVHSQEIKETGALEELSSQFRLDKWDGE